MPLKPRSVSEREAAVALLGEAMLRKLSDPKCVNRTQWAEGDFTWFLGKLQEEHQELIEGIAAEDLENIAEEAVDVANVALMVFDTAMRQITESASDSECLSVGIPSPLNVASTPPPLSEAPYSLEGGEREMIYIAGAIDLQTQQDRDAADPRDEAEQKLLLANIAVYRPDHAIKATDISVNEVAASIKRLNLAAIEASNGMVAVISSRMSVGTVMDMVHARQVAGIPVAVVLHGIRRPSYLVDWPVFASVDNAVSWLIGEVIERGDRA